MKVYEAVFIFDPELSEDTLDQLKDKIVNTINANGSLKEIKVWGRKKLAYPIKKKQDGIYYLFEFFGETSLPKELKRLTKITEPILRSMIIAREGRKKPIEAEESETPEQAAVKEIEKPEEVFYSTEEEATEEQVEKTESEVS